MGEGEVGREGRKEGVKKRSSEELGETHQRWYGRLYGLCFPPCSRLTGGDKGLTLDCMTMLDYRHLPLYTGIYLIVFDGSCVHNLSSKLL